MWAEVVDGVVVRFPYTVNHIREAYPNLSFRKALTPAIMETVNAVPVVVDDRPNVDPNTHTVVRAETPALVDGEWRLSWTVTPA